MKKNIADLKLTEEEKILISRIERSIPFLSDSATEYFDKYIVISPDSLKDAFSTNQDLNEILYDKEEYISEINQEVFSIRENHQNNFSKEIRLDDLKQKVDDITIYKNTLAYKDNFGNVDDKLNALSKREKYLQHRNKKRKDDFTKAMVIITPEEGNEEVLNIESMNYEIELINKYIDEKQINKTKY